MTHEYYMKIALDLARSAEGQTSPNPLVGAVCVKDGQIIGTGAHLKAGTPHAEVHALTMAGSEAKGADLYVTLEPCAHTGKTAPCTELVISTGIRRVFIASIDPFPAVNGKGIELLKAAGIEVFTGILKEEAEQLNRAFFHFIKHGKPYVTLKAASTLDGRLSTQTGDSKWITSVASRTDVHHLRHTHDAILVGVQTVLQDNPFLTTRLPLGGKNPIRIILDRRLRTPKTANVITDGAVETIIFTLDSAKKEPVFSEYPLVTIESISEEVDFLEEVLRRLATKGIMTLFVEGGSQVHSSFINEGLADELYLYMAPKLIGNGTSLFMDTQRNNMEESELLRIIDIQKFGEDIRLHAEFIKEE
ncbi:bifunctional diaminohydroxyphosphoribosylaminopyrimidine deaminase/5-amino-6-(5-phosphoribosylamino)uracil reductase RibD [Sporosarcina sp. G11-34]|uniref:bifunctional diaminohydroxyphosphoribosylaminopyrimidine deaminase/5-amino-6-(5-phosphoribosylamino)uracil reductase RibD n=1 Tax=Sporosarcina sp. G11-34 TaxID=2849605 RepID=UPI0022A8D8D3|nr:bifunctional diaminohydroxyphosphoribosylaminopyrimidine deaminase/5-amino-6-(5-phosphoribosylamino)uracil reductase RibD [Sporosarcina sp. G11-34]MCZ2257864.1 bifunctional diaminohydroxyphosphoribosylaminopyrimidine deaminase/5-amino-6-(5-phosphoribosylamino)uracil reductase RibD [Sporosarcina sp. G11-34]